jgi:hypothetical protein
VASWRPTSVPTENNYSIPSYQKLTICFAPTFVMPAHVASRFIVVRISGSFPLDGGKVRMGVPGPGFRLPPE